MSRKRVKKKRAVRKCPLWADRGCLVYEYRDLGAGCLLSENMPESVQESLLKVKATTLPRGVMISRKG
ncbi:MAG: hypothetical protein JXQ30_16765 [Spirochaetes bacterium]|nr:hypothetical protein [Spirochaetota bacterium]